MFFGWAKPVPIAPWRFRDPRRGMMLVALAGPLANYVLAFLSLLALHATPALPDLVRAYALIFIGYFLMANLALGTFNLLPIPPLDGGRVVGRAAAGAAGHGLGADGAGRHRRRAAGGVRAALPRWRSSAST